jgi:hypothetical protein
MERMDEQTSQSLNVTLSDGRGLTVYITEHEGGLVEVNVSAHREDDDDLTLIEGYWPKASWN